MGVGRIAVIAVVLIVGSLIVFFGLRARSIHVAMVGPMTGDDAWIGQGWRKFIELYFAEINRQGGIDGRRLVLDVYDDQGNSSVAREKAQEIIEKFGGTVKAGYAMLGRTDIVMVIDAPDTEAVMKISIGLSRMSGIAFTSAPAVSFDEFDKYMEEV